MKKLAGVILAVVLSLGMCVNIYAAKRNSTELLSYVTENFDIVQKGEFKQGVNNKYGKELIEFSWNEPTETSIKRNSIILDENGLVYKYYNYNDNDVKTEKLTLEKARVIADVFLKKGCKGILYIF